MTDRRSRGGAGTALATAASAAVLVATGLAPGLIAADDALALLRVPVEAMVVVLLLIFVRPAWARRALAVCASALTLLAGLVAALDRVFQVTLSRGVDLSVLWPELASGLGAVQDSIGTPLTVIGIVLVAIVVIAGGWAIAASYLHLAGVLASRRRKAVVSLSSTTAAWAVLAIAGAQVVPGYPIAAADIVDTVIDKAGQTVSAAADRSRFAGDIERDGSAEAPGTALLSGLAGKDVLVVFVESYGRVAVQDSSFSPGVDAVLRGGGAQLTAHGYQQRSAFMTSPTFGGVSWLAHSTLQSGLWIDSPRRYDQATSSARRTLASTFHDAGWRTVSDIPSNTTDWPVGRDFYHYDLQLNATNVGYRGPSFSYARIPDQYTLSLFRDRELAEPHKPVMAEIDLVSSHTPWTPLPRLVPWDELGDGHVYDPQPAQGLSPSVAWQDPADVQRLYGESIEYSLSSIFSFLTTFDDPNLVLLVLGDHQPAAIVSGENPSHDVPVSLIASDPAVLDRIDSWGWEQGMLPSPDAPLWRMDEFRDRFLSAFSDEDVP